MNEHIENLRTVIAAMVEDRRNLVAGLGSYTHYSKMKAMLVPIVDLQNSLDALYRALDQEQQER